MELEKYPKLTECVRKNVDPFFPWNYPWYCSVLQLFLHFCCVWGFSGYLVNLRLLVSYAWGYQRVYIGCCWGLEGLGQVLGGRLNPDSALFTSLEVLHGTRFDFKHPMAQLANWLIFGPSGPLLGPKKALKISYVICINIYRVGPYIIYIQGVPKKMWHSVL